MRSTLVATCYPWASRGLFLRGGVGTSSYKQRSYADYPAFRGSGRGWLAALGWDVRVDRRLSFTPMLTYRAGAPGTVAVFVDTRGHELATAVTGVHARADVPLDLLAALPRQLPQHELENPAVPV